MVSLKSAAPESSRPLVGLARALARGLINISEVLEETHFMDFVLTTICRILKSWWNLHPVGVVPFPLPSVPPCRAGA